MIEWLQTTVSSALEDNQFFAGGFVLAIMSWGMYMCRRVPSLIYNWFLFQCTVELEIRDLSVIEWFNYWLQEHGYAKRCRRMKVTRRYQSDEEVTILSPGHGWHLLREGRWFVLNVSFEETSSDGGMKDNSYGTMIQKQVVMTLRAIGRNPEVLKGIVNKTNELWQSSHDQKGKIEVHFNDDGCYWESTALEKRPLDSVHLPETMRNELCDDIDSFLEDGRREWYKDRGIPYRRGYLLHGPPGSGKSSLAKALASYYDLKLYIFNAQASFLSDSRLQMLMASIDDKAILLIEDADCIGAALKRDRKSPANKGAEYKLSTQGFLNAIDGVAAPEGHILLMTTNYPERLDKALLRDGRIDRKFELTWATAAQASNLFSSFFPMEEECNNQFAQLVTKKDISMAALQGILIRNPDSARDAVESLREKQA